MWPKVGLHKQWLVSLSNHWPRADPAHQLSKHPMFRGGRRGVGMKRGRSRRRALVLLGVAALAAGVAQAAPVSAAGEVSPAAATRYEAESGTCQGTIDSDHTGF